jgi:hypothetical protein
MTVGDWVEIICTDGATFRGILMHEHPDYIVLNGFGYARAGIVSYA